MIINVEPCDPRAPKALYLLNQSQKLMSDLYPSESNHFLSIDALAAPKVTFVVGKLKNEIVGCGAILKCHDYTEVKSMFTDPIARGQKVADQILIYLISLSKELGFKQMYLETGIGLDAAHYLYKKHGFSFCKPFGKYTEDPLSVCMHKILK